MCVCVCVCVRFMLLFHLRVYEMNEEGGVGLRHLDLGDRLHPLQRSDGVATSRPLRDRMVPWKDDGIWKEPDIPGSDLVFCCCCC